jgi:peptide/nickel transport system substrate-binding protein
MSTPPRHALAALACLALLAGCRAEESGPVSVVAIGGPPRLVNPNRVPLDPPSAFLVLAAAQGLVRFDAAGEIEPALAQRWIVSDDGLRYTFRLARADWRSGGSITAEQVAARLRAAVSASSRNPMKPILGAIDEIVAMTDEVLEISLKSPRPNFLQLLAQPELAVLRNGEGSGPFLLSAADDQALSLSLPAAEEEEEDAARAMPPLLLRGAAAPLAVAAFASRRADLVLGGTAGDLPVARAAAPDGNSLMFDPVAGLFGFSFASVEGPLARAEVRHALAMAVDRPGLVAALRVPGLQPRDSVLPPGIEGLAAPALPAWSQLPLAERRALAARTIAGLGEEGPVRIRVALSEAPGHRLLFAYLARDWAAIGVAAERVTAGAAADLRFIDEVAPIGLASWYLRHFACNASRVCDPAADEAMAAARIAPDAAGRRAMLAGADRLLAEAMPFIALAAPVRWSLVSPRLNGFRPNPFAHHAAGELIRPDP